MYPGWTGGTSIWEGARTSIWEGARTSIMEPGPVYVGALLVITQSGTNNDPGISIMARMALMAGWLLMAGWH